MLLSRFFKRRSTVVERVQDWTAAPPVIEYDPPEPNLIKISVPLTVDGALIAHQIERRGLA